MSSRKMISKKIKTNLVRNNNKAISILMPTDQMDYKSMYNGLMPNLIHSLDASNIHLLIDKINKYYVFVDKKNINLYTIHDCFATDYKNMKILEILVRISFIELYFKEDYLSKLNEDFINQIESCTTVFTESFYDTDIKKIKYLKYIEIENKNNKINKIYLPQLPNFN